MFQFLIGTIKTYTMPIYRDSYFAVSIPYRYDKNIYSPLVRK